MSKRAVDTLKKKLSSSGDVIYYGFYDEFGTLSYKVVGDWFYEGLYEKWNDLHAGLTLEDAVDEIGIYLNFVDGKSEDYFIKSVGSNRYKNVSYELAFNVVKTLDGYLLKRKKS